MQRSFLVASASLLILAVAATDTFAQPGGRRDRGRFGGPMGGRDSEFGLLMNEEVRKELGIVDSQMEALESIMGEVRDEMRSRMSGMRDLSPEERREKFREMREEMEEMRSQIEDRVKDVLLPNQVSRLKQINLQMQMSRDASRAITSDSMAEALGLSAEQKQKLQSKAEEVRERVRKEIERVRKDAENDLLSVLTPEQRSKLEELRGDSIDAEKLSRFGGRGQRGDRGERGRRGPRGER